MAALDHKDNTFRNYTGEQGATYARMRPGYHSSLYELILAHHTSTSGQLGTVLDVGCGPGTAVRAVAPRFQHALGVDPSAGMLAAARADARNATVITATGEPIRFEEGSAEALEPVPSPAADGTVDLITAATCAHWFHMRRFWRTAARVLRPGGTVALWEPGKPGIAAGTPNAAAIQAWVEECFHTDAVGLAAYRMRDTSDQEMLCENLDLPWNVADGPPVDGFDEATFFRKVWSPSEGGFLADEYQELSLDALEKMWSTMGTVTRWREAHPGKVGTEEDPPRIIRRGIERLLQEAGVKPGEKIKGGVSGVLLMVKRR